MGRYRGTDAMHFLKTVDPAFGQVLEVQLVCGSSGRLFLSLMESHSHVAIVIPIDPAVGRYAVQVTSDYLMDVQKILKNLPMVRSIAPESEAIDPFDLGASD